MDTVRGNYINPEIPWDLGSSALKNENILESPEGSASNEVYNVPAINTIFKELDNKVTSLDKIGSYLGSFLCFLKSRGGGVWTPPMVEDFHERVVSKNDFITVQTLTHADRLWYNESAALHEGRLDIGEFAEGHPVRFVVLDIDTPTGIIDWMFDVVYSWDTVIDVSDKQDKANINDTPSGSVGTTGGINIAVFVSSSADGSGKVSSVLGPSLENFASKDYVTNTLDEKLPQVSQPIVGRLSETVGEVRCVYSNRFGNRDTLRMGTLVYEERSGRGIIGRVLATSLDNPLELSDFDAQTKPWAADETFWYGDIVSYNSQHFVFQPGDPMLFIADSNPPYNNNNGWRILIIDDWVKAVTISVPGDKWVATPLAQ